MLGRKVTQMQGVEKFVTGATLRLRGIQIFLQRRRWVALRSNTKYHFGLVNESPLKN
jgi:hypothetical protein